MKIGSPKVSEPALDLEEPDVPELVSDTNGAPDDTNIIAIARTARVPAVSIKYTGLPPFATAEACRLTSEFKHMKFQCEWFNPLQTQFLPEVEKDNNVVVSGKTSSGKTTVAEMVASYTLGQYRQDHYPAAKVAYISPLKALASEKEQDWTAKNHWFYQYNVSILTGDYILTPERKQELAQADIICMSSEMLGSRVRRNKTEHNNFLMEIKTLIVDEAHLTGVVGRGSNLEVALMKFTKVNPSCRIIFLSATMPNVQQLGDWLTKLNGKPSTIIDNDYRPVKLNWNFEPFEYDVRPWAYHINQATMVNEVLRILQRYSNDKFIVFVHAKTTGRKILDLLKTRFIPAEFHNADLSKEKRQTIEASFKSRETGSLRVLVATSTLAWGLNMPARRVIIAGIHRGLNLVDSLDITQMCGRSGRVGLDKMGDAHILIRSTHKEQDITFCQTVNPVTSQISDEDAVAFHLISEIAEGHVTNLAQATAWFERSLAHHQRLLGEGDDTKTLLSKVLQRLQECGATARKVSTKELYATAIGKVASWFYFSPFDVAHWANNLYTVLSDPEAATAYDLSWAIGNIPSNIKEFSTENMLVQEYSQKLRHHVAGGAGKHCYAWYCILTHKKAEDPAISVLVSRYRMDTDRLAMAFQSLHVMGNYFADTAQEHLVYELPYRMRYGVTKGLELTILPGVGTETAKHIMSRRIYTCKELVAAHRTDMPVLSAARWEKVKPIAEEIARVGYIEYLKRKCRR